MPEMTATQRLADHMLDGGLHNYVLTRRAKGDSWRRIALDLRDDVGIDVTHETVRSWYFADDEAVRIGGAA
jgi:intein-encoded DNA endonuclease-like protein